MDELLLTEGEMGWLVLLASLRNIIAVRTRTNDYRVASSLLGIEADIDGIIGEYAFCRWRNIFFDPIPQASPGGYDCITNDGIRIDVKTTRLSHGRLMVNLKDNPDVDLYVLAIIDGHKVKFPGYAPKKFLCQESNIVNPTGKKQVYALQQHQLRTTWSRQPNPSEQADRDGNFVW